MLFFKYFTFLSFSFFLFFFFFFFNDTATTEIYTLSLHDALPISALPERAARVVGIAFFGDDKMHRADAERRGVAQNIPGGLRRSEEHTSELQSQSNLVCRLLLEKKKIQIHQDLRR